MDLQFHAAALRKFVDLPSKNPGLISLDVSRVALCSSRDVLQISGEEGDFSISE
jgi:hypothetical protein